MNLLPWLVIVVLTAGNAVYVAAEFAAVAVQRTQLMPSARGGDRRAVALIETVRDRAALDRHIAACQIGITLTSLIAGAYAQATIAFDVAVLHCLDHGDADLNGAAASERGDNAPADHYGAGMHMSDEHSAIGRAVNVHRSRAGEADRRTFTTWVADSGRCVRISEGFGVDVTQFPARHRGSDTLGNKRIVIVDDDDDAREILRLILEGCSAQVVEASSAAEAMRALETWPADLLISDIGMPGRDGYALIQEVRVAPVLALLPAIALTSYTSGKDEARALRAGFNVHLGKPMDVKALIAAVAALLQSRKR